MRKIDSSNKLILIKICLYFIDLFYWVSGVMLLCIGVSVQMKLYDAFVVVNETSSGVPVIITIVGGVIISVSAFGAIAILKSNHMMIKVIGTMFPLLQSSETSPVLHTLSKFTGMLLIIFLIEIIVGISAYAYRGKLHDNLLRSFLKTLDKYNRESQVTKGVDHLQENFQCCGAQNYTDWFNTTFGSLNSAVPNSCCKITKSCGTNLSNDTANINQQGCIQKLKKWAEERIALIGGVCISVGFAQLLGILFSYMLLRLLNEDYVNL
ncbi:CD63 antigen-like isoform X1 [Dermochelys coriacea]|uniref:CD63 antigen-like isoform X1 n=1 Tax=Dermochelys coriacea TaxID=27794 RepID=UPI001CAA399E|nr:CD63 antigen-like isoform X1 [Dermochelys coriacea]